MAIQVYQSVRLVLRRSVQRQHSFHASIKRQKGTTAEKPAEKLSQSSTPKEEIKSAPSSRDDSPPPFPLPLWQRLGPVSGAINAYGRTQRKRPWATQLGTSLVIYFFGDMAAQNIGGEDYNPSRTARHLTIGAISSIPAYSWYQVIPNHARDHSLMKARFMYLHRSFNYPSHLLSLAVKVGVNQIVFTPIFNSYFFGMQSFLAGDTMPEVWERIRNTVPTSIVNSLKLWPAVTAFNFTYIQPQYRALFAGQ